MVYCSYVYPFFDIYVCVYMSNISIGMMCNRISTMMYKMLHSFFVCISCRSDKVVNMTHLIYTDDELSEDGSDTMISAFI